MKIITAGDPWYFKQRVKCPGCGCEVELELGDIPKMSEALSECRTVHMAELLYRYVECPHCDGRIKVKDDPSKNRCAA